MKTVNSVSGGKTSSYLAVHYPADYNIFSLVRIEDTKCTPKDKKLAQIVSDKIGMEFIATAESDITLNSVLQLEQKLGKEIIWVTGITFDELIRQRKYLPNLMARFCTSFLKIEPIFNYCQKNIGDMVYMNLGIRYDEKERGFDEKTGRKKPDKPFKHIISINENGTNKWAEKQWRITQYPLILNRITHYDIKCWADNSGIIFPLDSNCVGCFHKQLQQLRKNWDDEPEKMQWFADQEIGKRKWKKEANYTNIKKLGLEPEFNFGTGSGCQAGFCTD